MFGIATNRGGVNRLKRISVSWWYVFGFIVAALGIGTVTYILNAVGLIALGLLILLCFIVLWALGPQRMGVLWVLFAASFALLPFSAIRMAVGTLMVPLSAFISVLPIGIICLRFLVTRDVRLEDRGILMGLALLLFGNTASLMVAQAPELGALLLAKWFFHSLLLVFLMSFRDKVWHVRTLLTLILVTGVLSAYGLFRYAQNSYSYDVNFYTEVGTRAATAQHLALLLPLAVGLGVTRQLSSPIRLSIWSSIVVSFIALAFTFNRSAWLAVLVGLSVLSFTGRRRFIFVLPMLCILLLGYVGPQEVVDRFWSIFTLEEDIKHHDITNAERLELQLRGVNVIVDHPIFGVGLGNFALNVPKVFASAHKSPHDFYLTTWAEGGVLAFVGLLGVLYFATRRVVQGIRETTEPLSKDLLKGALGSLASLFVQMFFSDDLNHILAWTVLGLSVSAAHLGCVKGLDYAEHRDSQDLKNLQRVQAGSQVGEALPVGGAENDL